MGYHTYINQARTAADLVRGYAMLATVLRTSSRATVLPFDAAVAAVSARLVTQRVRLRRMDLRIAAIALARGLVVVTRNTQDFSRVLGLQAFCCLRRPVRLAGLPHGSLGPHGLAAKDYAMLRLIPPSWCGAAQGVSAHP
jgi:hypothetical protein